jgi:site-specific recombinase XerD
MTKRWRQEVADFLRFCAVERRLAPMTVAAHERDVWACVRYLQGGINDLADVKTHLRAFLAEEQKRRPALSSQARATAALKSFFRFLVEEERLVRDPALPLRTPKKREVLPDVLTMGELERLLAQPGRDELWERHFHRKPERDRLPLALMAYAGLRRSELLGLDWNDVDLSRRLLRVRKAKGGRQRTIPIHPALAPLYAEYYATRVPLTEQAVFVGVQGKPACLRLRAPSRRRQTPPDPGTSRPQAPRLDPALHACERTRAERGDQETPVGWRASGSPSTLSAMRPETRRRWRDYRTAVAPRVAPRPKATRRPGRYQDRCHFLTGRVPMAAGWTARIRSKRAGTLDW